MSVMYEVLRQLDEWRHLPAYQLERRVDVFFGMFLPKVMEKTFGVHVDEVIPEFPLHKGLLTDSPSPPSDSPSHHSVKVDFAVFGHQGEEKRALLIELKTDMESLSEIQLKNMALAKAAGPEYLFRGVIEAAKHSESKHKYAHLIWRLLELECLRSGSSEITDIALESDSVPKSVFAGLDVGEKWGHARVSLVAILPAKPTDSNKKKIPCGFEILTFAQFAGYLENRHLSVGSGEIVFADRLREWGRVEAGRVSPWAHSN